MQARSHNVDGGSMHADVLGWVMGMSIVVATAACGSNSMAPAPAPAPALPSPTALAGIWTGAVGVSADDGRSLGLVWSAEANGEALSGPATLSTLPSAPVPLMFVGTLTGAPDREQLLLTYASEAVTLVDGSSCTVSATGNAHLEGFTLVGNLAVVYRSCDRLGVQPPASMKLQLLKKLN
jgi:hypothetical protein